MGEHRNSPDLAAYSYYLAVASVTIMILAMILTFIPLRFLAPLVHIIWLTLITSAAGTFLAVTARNEFKRRPPTEDEARHARIGLRVNVAALIFMLLLMLAVVLVNMLGFVRG
jgi:hypothetical protein